jgi:nicotinamide riboside kinase
MQTATASEATLPELIQQVRKGPVLIRDGGADVAVLVAPDIFWQEQMERVERSERSREEMVQELSKNLRKAGISYVDFVRDILR